MTEYLRVHDWRQWQSYRSDRGQPPWIKVHRCLMRDHKWVALTDAQRGQLISIWILAADDNGLIPACAKLVQKLCYLDEAPDLECFVNQGLLERGVKVASQWRQGDAPEAETETETKEENRAKKRKPQKRFTPPTLDEVKAYCRERRNAVDPERFVDFYAAKGWMVGKNRMKDWQAAVRTWEKSDKPQHSDPADRRLT